MCQHRPTRQLQEVPRPPQDAPRPPQSLQNHPKRLPGPSQEGTKTARDPPKWPQECTLRPSEVSSLTQIMSFQLCSIIMTYSIASICLYVQNISTYVSRSDQEAPSGLGVQLAIHVSELPSLHVSELPSFRDASAGFAKRKQFVLNLEQNVF